MDNSGRQTVSDSPPRPRPNIELLKRRIVQEIPRTESVVQVQADSGQTATETASTSTSRKRKRGDDQHASEPVDIPLCAPWNVPTPTGSVEQQLHHEILSYVAYVQSTPQEQEARRLFFSVLEASIKRRFYNASVHMFGSSVTGLTLPGADLDIVVSSPSREATQSLFQLRAQLQRTGVADNVRVNHRAKVPILTFTSLPAYGSFRADIGINNSDGLQGVAVINTYLHSMPALRPLVLVMKAFLAQRGLGSAASSGLGSYALTCLCIAFLKLNPGNRPPKYIDDPLETQSLGTLLTDFFVFYGNDFPYKTHFISAKEGRIIPKAGEEWINSKSDDRFVIRCLMRDENDVGKPTSKVEQIRLVFKEAAVVLLQASLNDKPGPGGILGMVVKLRKSTVAHRTNITWLVDTGRLQKTVADALAITGGAAGNHYAGNQGPSSRGGSWQQHQYQQRQPRQPQQQQPDLPRQVQQERQYQRHQNPQYKPQQLQNHHGGPLGGGVRLGMGSAGRHNHSRDQSSKQEEIQIRGAASRSESGDGGRKNGRERKK